MIVITGIEHPVLLVKLQRTITQFNRWVSGDSNVTVANDGLYTAQSPVLRIRGHGAAGSRLERREWSLDIADPNEVYSNQYDTNWLYLQCTLMVRWSPAAAPAVVKVGGIIGRQVGISDEGRTLNLRLGTLLDRAGSTSKALTNDASQREVLSTDDSMLYTQDTLDVIWGSTRTRLTSS